MGSFLTFAYLRWAGAYLRRQVDAPAVGRRPDYRALSFLGAGGDKGRRAGQTDSETMADKGKSIAVVPPRKHGRPTAYNLELAEYICGRISEGELLNEICEDPDMPPASTVRGWDYDDRHGRPTVAVGFSAMYTRAKESQIECELEDIRRLSEQQRADQVIVIREVFHPKTGERMTVREIRQGDNVAARTLEIETRKWRIAKIGWRVYGTRAAQLDPAQLTDKSEPDKIIVEGGLPEERDDPTDTASSVDEDTPE